MRAGRCGRSDRGAGTILVLAAVGVLMAFGLIALALGSLLLLHTRAASAADLAALAGASVGLSGSDAACERAGEVATANGARVESCRLVGTDVWVEVAASAPQQLRRLVGPSAVRARAHAELLAVDPDG